MRQYGASRRRTWRKRHPAVDADSHEVVAAELTVAFVGDAEVLPDLLAQLPAEASIAIVAADGADDTQVCHPALLERRVTALIPPHAGAVAWPPLAESPPHPRKVTLDAIQQYGRTRWKPLSGYHRRSLAEAAMLRLQRFFGGHLKNHRFDPQTIEAYAHLAALNIMTRWVCRKLSQSANQTLQHLSTLHR